MKLTLNTPDEQTPDVRRLLNQLALPQTETTHNTHLTCRLYGAQTCPPNEPK